MLGVICLTQLTKGIYKAWTLDLLEASYILNLGVLAYYVKQAGGNQDALTYVSVGIAWDKGAILSKKMATWLPH